MMDGGLEGMQTFDQVLERFVREGLITLNSALAYATNRNNLLLSLQDLATAPQPPESASKRLPPPAAGRSIPPRPEPDGKSMLDMIEKY
jgi:hypothetical protein